MSTELFKPTITDFDDEKQLYHFAEAFVIDEMFEIIGSEGTFRLALSGGSTPLPLYERLGANPSLPWEEVEIYQTDERFVPKNSPESNQTKIQNSIGLETLDRIKESYFIPTETTIEYALNYYNTIINSLDMPTFDLVILGIGKDGHIASLFPKGNYSLHQDRFVILTIAESESPIRKRISLTLEAILNSKKILVLLNGVEKSDILSELVSGSKPAQAFPAKFLLAHPNLNIFVHIPKNADDAGED